MGLKILHVGNIAQNGYINASILRARGHDCDLVAPDLLHAGSSPEWYELSTGELDLTLLGDDLVFPDFYALGRAMPEIGEWVAHGPNLPALIYLLLKRRGDPRAHTALSALCYYRFKMTMRRTTNPAAAPVEREEFEAHLARYDLRPALRRRIRLGRMAEDYWNSIVNRIEPYDPGARGWVPPISTEALDGYCAQDPHLEGIVRGLRKHGLAEALFIEFAGPLTEYERLARNGFTAEEAAPYLWAGRVLRDLVACYDVSVFYGDGCKFAFAAGIEGYWALEHGTIRTLPFEPNVNGRFVAAGFLNAGRVFLTNTDYATAVPRLEFAPAQRVYFPHPFDEQRAAAFRRDHPPQRDPHRAVFFCPARQEWASGNSDMLNNNDRYFYAGRILLNCGRTDFLFHCIDWGVDRDASRALVAELGLGDQVRWSPILPKPALWSTMLNSHAVIDQFHLSAIGGISVEALALGARLISRDDGINNAVFFEAPPPVLAAATAEEIAARMLAVMDDPQDLAGIGEEGTAWVRRHHSAERIHDLQMLSFAGHIDGNSDRSADASSGARCRLRQLCSASLE